MSSAPPPSELTSSDDGSLSAASSGHMTSSDQVGPITQRSSRSGSRVSTQRRPSDGVKPNSQLVSTVALMSCVHAQSRLDQTQNARRATRSTSRTSVMNLPTELRDQGNEAVSAYGCQLESIAQMHLGDPYKREESHTKKSQARCLTRTTVYLVVPHRLRPSDCAPSATPSEMFVDSRRSLLARIFQPAAVLVAYCGRCYRGGDMEGHR